MKKEACVFVAAVLLVASATVCATTLDTSDHEVAVPRDQCRCRSFIVETLKNFTAEDEAALFAVMDRYGKVRIYKHGAIDTDSVMRFGSITKPFVAWLALKAGLSLQDRPSRYGFIPALYSKSNTIKFKEILSHTAGIQEYAQLQYLINMTDPDPDNWDWMWGGDFTVQRDIDVAWKNKPLNFLPGTKYCYSNTDCEIVGKVTQQITGKSINQLISEEFNGISIDDGTTPLSEWPQTPAYLNWPYPVTLPGVSGTLIGTARGLLRSFRRISKTPQFETMKTWKYDSASSHSVPQCSSDVPGYNIAGGQKYGYFIQYFNSSQIYSPPSLCDKGSIGHDGDLIARSIIVEHPSGNLYLYHYTNSITNEQLQQQISELVYDHLQNC
jgi:hypothetical protein